MTRKLTQNQNEALKAVQSLPGSSTHEIAESLGHHSGYETTLRDRLFGLAHKGLIRFEEYLGREAAFGPVRYEAHVVARRWYPVEKGGE